MLDASLYFLWPDAMGNHTFLEADVEAIPNLDHSVLNHEVALDGDPDNDVYLPTMFPVQAENEEWIVDLSPDDRFALLGIYDDVPTPGIAGIVSAGGVPFQGAHVVLREASDPRYLAYSVISGDRFQPCNPGSSCDPCDAAAPV